MKQGVSEFDLIRRICDGRASADPRVLIGPGDDLAMIKTSPPEGSAEVDDRILLGVDQLVDGLHVDLKSVALHEAGRKAVCRSLSDIAAMAGRPVATLVSALIPAGWNDEQAMALFDSMRSVASEYHAPLVGGDLAVHQDADGRLACSVTVIGSPSRAGAISRFGAQSGDGLYVTGELGGSWRCRHHLEFVPRLAESAMLMAILGDRLHAMIDISDGLGRDASHMIEESDLAVTINGDKLPCREGFDVEHAVGDGEDYELLFAASGDVPVALGGCPVTRIGEFRECEKASESQVLLDWKGEVLDVGRAGWEHGSS